MEENETIQRDDHCLRFIRHLSSQIVNKENPDLIKTAKCKLPLESCLANPEYIALPGCIGNTFTVGEYQQWSLL